MELFGASRRTSGNFVQYKTDDGSLDYSADWDTFSFETELNTRKNILEEDVKAYNELLDQSSENTVHIGEITDELQYKKESIEKLCEANEDVFSKYNSLLEERRTIKENLQKLSAKNNSLLKIMKDLEEEESKCSKEYKQLKLALQKASKMYTTYFNINISTKIVSDTTYEASLYFNEKGNMAPIKFTADRIKRKVIDFQSNGLLFPKEEETIRKEFGDLENLPGLFCALRDVLLKK